MVEKGLRGGIYHAVHQYVTANNKYMKDYDKNKESLYLQYWNVNNLYGWVMSQKRPENNFELVKVLLNLMKILWKTIMKKVMKDIFLMLLFSNFIMVYNFYMKEWRLNKVEKLVANLHDQFE